MVLHVDSHDIDETVENAYLAPLSRRARRSISSKWFSNDHLQLCHNVKKRTFWYVRPRKSQICAVWSEILLSSWRNFASLAIKNVPRKDFDMTANEQADLNLRLAHLSKGAFFLRSGPIICVTSCETAPSYINQTNLRKIRSTCAPCPRNFDPLKPNFYIVKGGFTGVYIIFLTSAQNIDCGYSLEPPRGGGSNE